MDKTFEDYFSELQADMVSICLEYVNKKADKIFIYCSRESGVVSSDYFYYINGKVVERHKLNEVVNDENFYDVSVDRQDAVLGILNDDILQIVRLCNEYGREIPSEIKLVYDVTNNSVVANYKYGNVYSEVPDKTSDDVAEEWFAEVQTQH